ncbi:MAG: endonuclease [Candidatus Cloacimonetes bacterium]|nr:endonuclease [Candidatus Cloacimonadota bacterium]
MRIKYFISFIIFLAYFFAYAQIPAGYYDSASGLSGEALKTALHNIIDNHTSYSYSSTSADNIMKEADRDPNNSNNHIEIYTGDSELSISSREHVWAKSHGDFGTGAPAGCDLHNLKPSQLNINQSRSNKDFDTGGTEVSGAPGNYADSDSWEPRDAVKGDVARIIFYMSTRYEGDSGEPDLEVVDGVETVGNTTLSPWYGEHGNLAILLQWNEDDPVDTFEQNRNNVLYYYQNNRNPFIDHPEYADYIWGGGSPSIDPNVLISEICDPTNDYAINRFIEIYNSTNDVVDLTGWSVVAVGNGSDIFTWNLSGSIASAEALVCGDDQVSGFTVDFSEIAWSTSNSTWNGTSTSGGDGVKLYDSSKAIIDDASSHGNFSNSTSVRNSNIGTPTTTFSSAEWTSTGVANATDASPGVHTSNYPLPIDPPIAYAATSVNNNSFISNWSSITEATGYYLDVATDIGFSSYVSGYNNLDVGNNTSHSVTSLAYSTYYYYRVRAYDATETSTNSNIITVQTAASGGNETFANFPESGGTYQDGSFTGQDGSTWQYDQCRGDWLINGKTPCLGQNRTPTSRVESGIISGGCGILSFDYMKPYDSSLDLDVYVNTTVVENITGGDGSIQSSGNIIVNISGDFTLKFLQHDTGAGQVSIDNVVWTEYSTGPIPDIPVAISATSITTSSFDANWNSSSGATSYQLDVATDAEFGNILTGYNNLGVSSTIQSVTSLCSNTDYFYRVRAVNANGSSGDSNIISLTTNSESSGSILILSELCDPDVSGYRINRFIEITNIGTESKNLSGWSVTATANTNPTSTFTWNLFGIIAPGQSLVCGDDEVSEFTVNFKEVDWSSSGCNYNWNGKINDGAYLQDASKAIVDQIIATGDFFNDKTLTRNKDIQAPSGVSDPSEWTATPVTDILLHATPGTHETENPLPVTLSSFTAIYDNDCAKLYWTTQTEQNNAYWNIYRSISENIGQASKINEELILGSGTTFIPTEYEFTDNIDVITQTTYWYWIESVDISGFTELHGSISLSILDNQDNPNPPELDELYGLFPNYPNPFNPRTTIHFRLPKDEFIEVTIYNLKGQKIDNIFSGDTKSDELTRIVWDAPANLPSGMYFYRLHSASINKTHKMLLLK